jgi:hypothetical protein
LADMHVDGVMAHPLRAEQLRSEEGAFLFGIPLYLFLRARNSTTFPIAAAFGFMVGALTVSLILGRDMSSDTFNLAGLSGAAVGAILWLIDQPGRQTQ